LEALRIPFELISISSDESFPEDLESEKVAEFVSEQKARACRVLKRSELLITADTVVIFEDKIFGKPKNRENAIEMLTAMSGNEHKVISGVSLATVDSLETFSETTVVHFQDLNIRDIEYYVDSFEPYDKAGAYGIQEWIGMLGIRKIEGDYFNVVGLPLSALYQRLSKYFNRT